MSLIHSQDEFGVSTDELETCYHTIKCCCANPNYRQFEKPKETSHSKSKKVIANPFFTELQLESFGTSLGLNSRYAQHRKIKQRNQSRSKSIFQKTQKVNLKIKRHLHYAKHCYIWTCFLDRRSFWNFTSEATINKMCMCM